MSAPQHVWRIAIVDQQSGPARLWRRALHQNHQLHFFESCDDLLHKMPTSPDVISDEAPHLLIIDWDGPDGQAAKLLNTLRREHENGTAIIAVVDEESPQQGIDACSNGANEFITRPIDQYELLTRVVNLLEHRPKNLSLPEHYPPFRFDLNRRTVAYAGEIYRPRPREFDLMLYLFRRHDQVITRTALKDNVWFGESDECRSIDTYISRIRRLFGLNGESGWMIKSVYRRGYRLLPFDDTSPD